MGLTNKTISSINFLKIQGLKKDAKEHYFELNGERSECMNFVGKLTKVKNDSYEYEGKERKTTKWMFADGGEFYQLDSSWNSLTRGLVNSLIGWVEEQKSKKGRLDLALSLYKNKEGYKQLGLTINGERGTWKYDIPTQKSLIEEIKNSKGEVLQRDYTAFDEKLMKDVEKINDYIDINDFAEEVKKKEENLEEVFLEDPIEKKQKEDEEQLPF